MKSIIDETTLDTVRNGSDDAAPILQKCINIAAEKRVPLHIPQGIYKVCKTLLLPSNCSIIASDCTKIFLDGDIKKQRGDYLLSNADTENGNENISITGGIWDGNNKGAGNAKPDIFDKDGYSGTVLNFCGVKNLKLSGLVVANSVTYNIRMAKIENFEIENISFVSDAPGHNQDGLHFNGEVRHGRVKNIRALSYGQTNDDLIALNADDSMERVENFGMVRGAIEDIEFEEIFAENCHTIIRILSTVSPIRNISIKNVYGGFRCYAINADGARYCRTPLFKEDEMPEGCGIIENVHIENMTCFNASDMENPAICLESLANGFEIKNFNYLSADKEAAFMAKNITATKIVADDSCYIAENKKDIVSLKNFKKLVVLKK